MEDQASWRELTEQVMEVAPALENKSGLFTNGMDAFTIEDLARELEMDDAEQKRQLSIVVGQLVTEGRLIGHTKLNESLIPIKAIDVSTSRWPVSTRESR